MKDNIEEMTITELAEEANDLMLEYDTELLAVLDGLNIARGLIGESGCEPDKASLLYVLVKRMTELYCAFDDKLNNLLPALKQRALTELEQTKQMGETIALLLDERAADMAEKESGKWLVYTNNKKKGKKGAVEA